MFTSISEVRKLTNEHYTLLLSVMRYIEPPNQILRYALIQGLKIESFAPHVGSFIAVSLFHTSALALDGGITRE